MTEANNDPAKANKDPAAYIAEERRANFEPETAVQLGDGLGAEGGRISRLEAGREI
jgi:hypothetical protein